jgi:hypothetical protein
MDNKFVAVLMTQAARIFRLEAELSDSCRQIDRLEAALRPFAEAADWLDANHPGKDGAEGFIMIRAAGIAADSTRITFGHLRDARAAIGGG